MQIVNWFKNPKQFVGINREIWLEGLSVENSFSFHRQDHFFQRYVNMCNNCFEKLLTWMIATGPTNLKLGWHFVAFIWSTIIFYNTIWIFFNYFHKATLKWIQIPNTLVSIYRIEWEILHKIHPTSKTKRNFQGSMGIFSTQNKNK